MFKCRGIQEVYLKYTSVQQKSRSINEVLLKNKPYLKYTSVQQKSRSINEVLWKNKPYLKYTSHTIFSVREGKIGLNCQKILV